jgi:type IV secretion system protein TrbL
MNDLGVIDHFLFVFSTYIDSGFGLLGREVSFLTATLVAIDITLAGLFCAMGGTDDVLAKLIKKTLYVGAFAFIITNFSYLSILIFRSFAGLGLIASGTSLTASQLLQPGRIASVGVDAGQPILAQIGDLTGFPGVFLNLDSIVVLLLAWLVVIVSFFVLAVQLFVTLIGFRDRLAGP